MPRILTVKNLLSKPAWKTFFGDMYTIAEAAKRGGASDLDQHELAFEHLVRRWELSCGADGPRGAAERLKGSVLAQRG